MAPYVDIKKAYKGFYMYILGLLGDGHRRKIFQGKSFGRFLCLWLYNCSCTLVFDLISNKIDLRPEAISSDIDNMLAPKKSPR